jgi:hypothetical protein
MTLKRTIAMLLLFAIALLGTPVSAEVAGNNSISVTSAAATTVTFSAAYTTVGFINGPDASGVASANEVYIRLFWCGETPAAATTSSPIRLQPGESVSFIFNPVSEASVSTTCKGYVGFSVITASTETANLRWFGK